MSRMFYPAIFTKEEDGYSVVVPDLDGCFSEGDTIEEAYLRTTDAIGLYLTDLVQQNKEIPKPSDPVSLKQGKNRSIVLIEFDMVAYNKKHNTKSVKKTLTIPQWLNEEAEKNNINFSSVLQKALIEQLNI